MFFDQVRQHPENNRNKESFMYHIRQFCEKHNTGLGIWSEQSTESLHSDFEKTWIRYKVSNLNPNYDSQLPKAVCDYNSKHISLIQSDFEFFDDH